LGGIVNLDIKNGSVFSVSASSTAQHANFIEVDGYFLLIEMPNLQSLTERLPLTTNSSSAPDQHKLFQMLSVGWVELVVDHKMNGSKFTALVNYTSKTLSGMWVMEKLSGSRLFNFYALFKGSVSLFELPFLC
jgi:hypothetical protein